MYLIADEFFWFHNNIMHNNFSSGRISRLNTIINSKIDLIMTLIDKIDFTIS